MANKALEPKCHDCGLDYEGFLCDFVIQNDLWAMISPTGDEGGLLCPMCILKRLLDLGLPAVKASIDTRHLRAFRVEP